jgi:hypothetical protein
MKNSIATMKNLLAAISIILLSNIVLAEDQDGEKADEEVDQFRTWTEEATKRTIEAKILERDDKKNTVTLQLKSMKNVVLDTSKLTEKDQEFVKDWKKYVEPKNQLTVRIVKSGISRGKRVEVDVQAGKFDVVVSGHSLSSTIKAGERKLFQVEVPDKYTFTLNDTDGNLVDQESALRKTGLTKPR